MATLEFVTVHRYHCRRHRMVIEVAGHDAVSLARIQQHIEEFCDGAWSVGPRLWVVRG